MSSAIDKLRGGIDAYWDSPEGAALKLRMQLAKLIAVRLQENGWTQRRLAQETDWKDSFLSRIIHGDENWTTETAGRALHALGIEPELVEAKSSPPRWRFHGGNGTTEAFIRKADTDNGQEIVFESSENPTQERISYRKEAGRR